MDLRNYQRQGRDHREMIVGAYILVKHDQLGSRTSFLE